MAKWIKIITSGHVIEVYTYEHMPTPNSGREDVDENDEFDEIQDDDQEERKDNYQAQNDRRSKWKFIRVINSNFNAMDKFITLTFAENVKDLDEANKQFKQFIQRMRYRYGEFKYGIAVEFQERGAVHYHMISNLPYIPKKKLAEIWRQGIVRINAIDHVDNVGAYISKYMTKGSDGRDERLRGRKMGFTSKNVDRPLIFKGDEADMIMAAYNLDTKETVLESCYPSEHHGLITYKQYNLKRNM